MSIPNGFQLGHYLDDLVTMFFELDVYLDFFFPFMCLLLGVFILHVYVTLDLQLSIFCFFVVNSAYLQCLF